MPLTPTSLISPRPRTPTRLMQYNHQCSYLSPHLLKNDTLFASTIPRHHELLHRGKQFFRCILFYIGHPPLQFLPQDNLGIYSSTLTVVGSRLFLLECDAFFKTIHPFNHVCSLRHVVECFKRA